MLAATLLVSAIALPVSAITIDSLADTSDTTPGDGICGTGVAGTCTLRAAIQEANGTAGSAQITITTSVIGNVNLGSALPVVTHPILLNTTNLTVVGSSSILTGLDINTSQQSQIEINVSGFTNVPNGTAVILRGVGNLLKHSNIVGNQTGVLVTGTGCAVSAGNNPPDRNIIINNGVGISLSGCSNATVDGNYIGVDGTGLAASANGIGILLSNSAQNTQIGGLPPNRSPNVISSNVTAGIQVAAGGSNAAFNTTISGNVIGTNDLQSAALPNAIGINILGGSGTSIGGTTFSATPVNIIAGNTVGIVVDNSTTFTTTIYTNAIGQTQGGTAMGNTSDGIRIHGGQGTVIGTGATDNVITSNGGAGILIDGGTNITVTGNHIGTNRLGTTAMPNANGIVLAGNLNGVTIGSFSNPADINTISGNTGDGVQVSANIGGNGGINFYGNRIGTNSAGTAALPNARGILVNSTDDIRIGEVGAGNLISGNTGAGVEVQNASSGLELRGNTIGLSSSNAALPNQNGILVSGGSGFFIGGSSGTSPNVISGNTVDGVRITGGTGVNVWGNRIGTDNAMTLARGNGANGIHCLGGGGNFGAASSGVQPNVIVSNPANGIYIESTGVGTVQYNLIGLNTSDVAMPNGVGVRLERSGTPVNSNVIAGNTAQGILNTASNTISGNKIGTNNAGTAAVPNGGAGIENTMFGTATITSNVISGNTGDGILASGTSPTTNLNGNIIGLNAAATAALPNGQSGVSIQSGFGSIGNTSPNTIAGNAGNGITIAATGITVQSNYIGTNSSLASGLGNTLAGVAVTAGTTNAILQNSISNNGGLGIDLGATGVTANDSGDGDTGANNLQNKPVLTTVVGNTVNGTLNSNANSNFRIEVFGNDTADASGSGQGKYYLGTTNVTTDASGNATFAVSGLTYPANARFVSATASRNSNETSEFSNDIVITPDININNVTQSEGNAGTTAFTFTVSLSQASTQTVAVNYATSNGTATLADSDYVATSGTLTFAPGVTSQTITVLVNGDTKFEANETFNVNLSGASNGNIATATGVGTINNDDAAPSVSINNVTQSEGNSGTSLFTFTISLSAPSGQTTTVSFATADGTATTADGDYFNTAGSVNFSPGVTSQSAFVVVQGDTKFEGDETFFVNLSSPTNATLGTASGTGTITNDDAPPVISISSVTQSEGTSGTTAFTFTVSLSAASGQTTTVNYATADGTATTADGDYSATSGSLTFAAGVTTRTVTVLVNGDTKFESNETFTVNLSGPTNATLGTASGTGTINNDDPQPSVSVGDVSQSEGDSGTTAFVFPITLSNASAQTVTVNYATADGTATVADGDYTAASGTVTFGPGVTTQTITVLVNGDTKFEGDDTFAVNLSAPTNATLGSPSSGTATIVNDDAQPSISIGNVSQNEGNSGTTSFTFTVSLSAPSIQTITVNYATADGTATVADSDYTAASGTLTFAPGVTSQTATVLVNGDTKFESNETFTVNLSSPTNATILGGTGTGTINNDDAQPAISIASLSQSEGNSGTTSFNFTVSLSTASSQTVSASYATADGTATVADGDYTASSGTVTFTPGQTTQTITVLVNGDTKFETNETFTVTLASPTNGTLGTATGTGTINNDDTQPAVSISSVSQSEGNAGTTPFVFTVALSNASAQTVSVNYATADGTATVADSDYTAASGTVTFAPGITTQTITVLVNGDTKFEGNDTFAVNLSGPANATLGSPSSGTGTINNDDAQPSISIGNVAQNEGNSGTTAFTFTASLSSPSIQTITVNYATADGTATVADGDYTAASGTLTFAPGVTSQTATVLVNGDTKFEGNESFTVNLSSPTNATILGGTGTGTINNDDTQPAISINDVTAAEGNAGTTAFTFTISLTNASSQTITVTAQTANGTASSGSDYAASGPTVLTFAPGVTTQTFTVNVNGDTAFEPNETFAVNLSGAANATIADALGVGTITNDDTQPAISINDVTAAEGNAGTTAFTFTVSLTNASSQTITVNAQTADGTASSPSDYSSAALTLLTFGPGVTTQTFTVNVFGDTTFEPNETFFVNLSGATNATIADAQGLGTITNDDPKPSISINDVTMAEGNSGTSAMTFTVSLSNTSTQTISVVAQTADGTATTASGDYVAAGPATLTFAPGVLTQTFTVNVQGDVAFEANETFFVNLTAPVNATIADNQGIGTIANDDGVPSISINDVAVNEAAGTATFTITLATPTAQTVTVHFATADNTATQPEDYTPTAADVTFAPGVMSQTVSVPIIDDALNEATETFFGNLSLPVNGVIADGQGVATITDNDPQPSLSISDAAAREGQNAAFTVTLSPVSGQNVTVNYTTSDGTATAGSDYTATSGTLTFAPGQTTQTISVPLLNDGVFETPPETFTVTISGAANATIATASATGTVTDALAVPLFDARTLMLLALALIAIAVVALRN